MADFILVAGSVHLDIVAEYDIKTECNIDKIGKIRISMGGSAFNIAANLALEKRPVFLYTHIREGSITETFIKEAIRYLPIDGTYIKLDPDLPESAFVAHMATNSGAIAQAELQSAVSCVGIQYCSLDLKSIEKAIGKSKLVTLDCNLTADQLSSIVKMAQDKKKPVFISGVSESKVHRIVEVANKMNDPFTLVVINLREARKLGLPPNEPNDDDFNNLKQICGTSSLVVTASENGYWIVAEDSLRTHFPVERTPEIVSTLGAGDALMAAICSHAVSREKIDWNECRNEIQKFVDRVLIVPLATSSSDFAGEKTRRSF